MNVTKKDLPKSQVELNIELTLDEFKPYITKGANIVSKEVKIEGFRPGKVPYEILKQKIGEMTILEEAAKIAINDTIGEAMEQELKDQEPVGQPNVDITKLAPDNPLEYKVVLAILPEVKLGDYKDAKVKEEKIEIKDEEVDKLLENLREMRVKEIISDQEVKDGDKALCDIEMFLDKVPIEGGQSKGTAVIVGKNYIIPGFDKKLIGAKKGEAREFELPYPKDFYQANLAGKNVEFKVKVNEVYSRELPKLSDELAKSMGAKDLADLKVNLKKNLEHEKEHQTKEKAEIEMLDKILAKTKFGDIPEMLVDHEAHAMMDELERTIASQGGKFEDYLVSIKKTHDQMMLDLLPDAVKRVKSALMIREIALKEKIEVTKEEVDKKIEEILEQYKGYEKVAERVKEPGYRTHLANIMANRKVVEKLRGWNVEIQN